ncbi:hypothetical protein LCGC14_1399270 [marine sediment metagenome]|uniref:Uncharacterized protein n=1 Tax=marine sediment metagenome TaxID=412755 RepID=A0A0F9JXT6_9ZZZZ
MGDIQYNISGDVPFQTSERYWYVPTRYGEEDQEYYRGDLSG